MSNICWHFIRSAFTVRPSNSYFNPNTLIKPSFNGRNFSSTLILSIGRIKIVGIGNNSIFSFWFWSFWPSYFTFKDILTIFKSCSKGFLQYTMTVTVSAIEHHCGAFPSWFILFFFNLGNFGFCKAFQPPSSLSMASSQSSQASSRVFTLYVVLLLPRLGCALNDQGSSKNFLSSIAFSNIKTVSSLS